MGLTVFSADDRVPEAVTTVPNAFGLGRYFAYRLGYCLSSVRKGHTSQRKAVFGYTAGKIKPCFIFKPELSQKSFTSISLSTLARTPSRFFSRLILPLAAAFNSSKASLLIKVLSAVYLEICLSRLLSSDEMLSDG